MPEVRVHIKTPNVGMKVPNVLVLQLETCATGKLYLYERTFFQCNDAQAISRTLRDLADQIDRELE